MTDANYIYWLLVEDFACNNNGDLHFMVVNVTSSASVWSKRRNVWPSLCCRRERTGDNFLFYIFDVWCKSTYPLLDESFHSFSENNMQTTTWNICCQLPLFLASPPPSPSHKNDLVDMHKKAFAKSQHGAQGKKINAELKLMYSGCPPTAILYYRNKNLSKIMVVGHAA